MDGAISTSIAIGGDDGDPVTRINQIYRAYLTSLFRLNFYQRMQRDTLQWARNLDFVVGLSAAISGGSGLGILAYHVFAWPCGIVTASALIITVAKSNWDWPRKIETANARVRDYGNISARYRVLSEDISFHKKFHPADNARFEVLRKEADAIPADPYDVGMRKQREIQSKIKSQEQYTKWWSWKEDE